MDILSKRALVSRDWEDFLLKYTGVCVGDPYMETTNPNGYVNLGTAENNLCRDITIPKLLSEEVWSCDTNLLQYRESYGIMRLRKAFATLMTQFFETHEIVHPENVFFVVGVSSCLDLLAHCLADPGEVFLTPTPVYGRIITDFKQRSLVDVLPIPVITENDTEDFPVLTMDKVIEAYENNTRAGRKIRGIIIINPNNPLGDILHPKLLMDVLTFCKEKSLHIILDEVYALSVYSETVKFHSVLKFPELPDPERTHVLYGLSKDFGIAGLRIGTIHTKCKPLQKCLMQLAFLQNIPYPVMGITAKYLEDLEWCKKYVSINQDRLARNYHFCVDFFKKIGLKVRESVAGFFIWIDLRPVCGTSFDQERDFFEYVIDKAHVFIIPGKEFFCAQPGWFRVIFAVDTDHLKEGLRRLEKAIREYRTLTSR